MYKFFRSRAPEDRSTVLLSQTLCQNPETKVKFYGYGKNTTGLFPTVDEIQISN
jgi:hypothetical protein